MNATAVKAFTIWKLPLTLLPMSATFTSVKTDKGQLLSGEVNASPTLADLLESGSFNSEVEFDRQADFRFRIH